jgi:hypothetical protein
VQAAVIVVIVVVVVLVGHDEPEGSLRHEMESGSSASCRPVLSWEGHRAASDP